MKKIILTLVACCSAVVSSQSFAADLANTTGVCVAQIATILPNSPQVKAATAELKKKFSKQQDEIKALQDKVTAAQKVMEKNAAVMSDEDQAAAKATLDADNQSLVTQIAEFQQAVSAEQTTQMKIVFDQLNEVIQSYADSNGCSVVLDSQFVVWSAPANDITADIQKAFDAAGSKK
jgi:Skp family chaperone for outer membrane proteins